MKEKTVKATVFCIGIVLGLFLSGCASSQSRVVSRATALPVMPITAYAPTQGDEMGSALKELAAVVERGGYTVEIVPEEALLAKTQGERVYGLHERWTKLISLNAGVPVNTQFETLAHEAGHIFHSPQLGRDSWSISEVFAELVGNRVQQHYGSRTAVQTSSDYLAGFKHAFATLQYLQKDMDFAVEVLTGKRAWPRRKEE